MEKKKQKQTSTLNPRLPFISSAIMSPIFFVFFFFFNDTATTEIYTLSLHDALPIFSSGGLEQGRRLSAQEHAACFQHRSEDRKSTRLNSSHVRISYAVFCLKKK